MKKPSEPGELERSKKQMKPFGSSCAVTCLRTVRIWNAFKKLENPRQFLEKKPTLSFFVLKTGSFSERSGMKKTSGPGGGLGFFGENLHLFSENNLTFVKR